MQVVFFITPVMYLPAQLSQRGVACSNGIRLQTCLKSSDDPILGNAPSDLGTGELYDNGNRGIGCGDSVCSGDTRPACVYWM